MLLVKTKLGSSSIHGTGVFAAEFIPQGTRVWELTPHFDFKVSREEIERLAEPMRLQMLMYSYTERTTGLCVVCTDNARHENHANEPNTQEIHVADSIPFSVATRDIQAGEEITCDYRTFDAAWKEKLGSEWPDLPETQSHSTSAAPSSGPDPRLTHGKERARSKFVTCSTGEGLSD